MSQCLDFSCGNARPGEPYTPDQCGKCWAAANVPAVARSLGRPAPAAVPPPVAPTRRPLPCRHEGAVLEFCTSCSGDRGEDRHVRGCDLWDRCTRARVGPAVRACVSCPDYSPEPLPPVHTRHLLYHVYPRRGGDWRTPVLRVREALPLFNGRRVVAVAHDGTTEHPVMVRDALAGERVDFIEVPNDPNLREVATFAPLFGRVADLTEPGHAVLYAHAKGVTRPADSTAGRWSDALHELYLRHWGAVERVLATHPVAGAFKKHGRGWQESQSVWHYSGSFWWFHAHLLFRKPDWRRIDRFWSGIESVPSLHFSADEAGCVFHEGRVPTLDLYQHGYWDSVVDPALARFRAENAPPPPERTWLNLGCGPHRTPPPWLNADTDAGVSPDVVVSAAGPLPLPDAHFERVYLGHVLEHVRWDDCPRVLAEVRRVCRPGAEVLAVGPDLDRAVARAVASGGAEADLRHVRECGEWQEFGGPPGRDHRWACRERRLVMLLEHAGLVGVRAVPVTPGELGDWPVASYDGAQCAARGTVP